MHYQAATLVAAPSFPDAIAWSEENLVAVASGHLITILNPAFLGGPRGLIILQPNEPFPIGVVSREDLLNPRLMPTCLSRDNSPFVRSISWSPMGFAPNSGCVLAACTTDDHVKLFRSPFCEFHDEWIEVVDISYLLYKFLEDLNFGDVDACLLLPQTETVDTEGIGLICQPQEPLSYNTVKRKRKSSRADDHVYDEDGLGYRKNGSPCTALVVEAGSKNYESRSGIFQVKAQKSRVSSSRKSYNDALPIITVNEYASRSALLAPVSVEWSPLLPSCNVDFCFSSKYCVLGIGSKSGTVSLWHICMPMHYTIEHDMLPLDPPILVGILDAHKSWVTAISWGLSSPENSSSKLVMVTGSSDGSVTIWLADDKRFSEHRVANGKPLSLLSEITAPNCAPVSTTSLVPCGKSKDKFFLAIGRASGSIEIWTCSIHDVKVQSLSIYNNVHDQVV